MHMSGRLPALGLTLDHRYHVTWITPGLARYSGVSAGMRAGSGHRVPWAVTRRYLEAVERCLDTGLAVAWLDPGHVDPPSFVGQAFPLPFGRGALVGFTPLSGQGDEPAPTSGHELYTGAREVHARPR